jgi:hypothetical protein
MSAHAELITALGNCPGLLIGDKGPIWQDSLGKQHELETARRLTICNASALIARDVFEVAAMIGRQELYPVACYDNSAHVFECGLRDYLRRKTVARTAQQEGTRYA